MKYHEQSAGIIWATRQFTGLMSYSPMYTYRWVPTDINNIEQINVWGERDKPSSQKNFKEWRCIPTPAGGRTQLLTPLRVGGLNDRLPKDQVWRGRNSNFPVGRPAGATWPRLKADITRQCRMVLCSPQLDRWSFFWRTHTPRLMMRENIKQTHVEAYPMKHTSETSLSTLSRPRKNKERARLSPRGRTKGVW